MQCAGGFVVLANLSNADDRQLQAATATNHANKKHGEDDD